MQVKLIDKNGVRNLIGIRARETSEVKPIAELVSGGIRDAESVVIGSSFNVVHKLDARIVVAAAGKAIWGLELETEPGVLLGGSLGNDRTHSADAAGKQGRNDKPGECC